MKEYFVNDTLQFFDAMSEIENEHDKQASIIINNNVDHCHLIRFLKDLQLTINGNNFSYNIYLDCKELSSNPEWKLNSTLFFHSNNSGITYSNLNFAYAIEQYDFTNDSLLDSFGFVLMEFYNSKIDFKDCEFENNTDRTFEIIIKKESVITFENCVFIGEFNFIMDIGSNVIIK